MASGNQHPKGTNSICFCFLLICWRSRSWIPEDLSHSIKAKSWWICFELPDLWRKVVRKSLCSNFPDRGGVTGLVRVLEVSVLQMWGSCLFYITVTTTQSSNLCWLFSPWKNCCFLLRNGGEINESLCRRRYVCEKDWHRKHFHSRGLIKGRFGAQLIWNRSRFWCQTLKITFYIQKLVTSFLICDENTVWSYPWMLLIHLLSIWDVYMEEIFVRGCQRKALI